MPAQENRTIFRGTTEHFCDLSAYEFTLKRQRTTAWPLVCDLRLRALFGGELRFVNFNPSLAESYLE